MCNTHACLHVQVSNKTMATCNSTIAQNEINSLFFQLMSRMKNVAL